MLWNGNDKSRDFASVKRLTGKSTPPTSKPNTWTRHDFQCDRLGRGTGESAILSGRHRSSSGCAHLYGVSGRARTAQRSAPLWGLVDTRDGELGQSLHRVERRAGKRGRQLRRPYSISPASFNAYKRITKPGSCRPRPYIHGFGSCLLTIVKRWIGTNGGCTICVVRDPHHPQSEETHFQTSLLRGIGT
jgi:hypothetical protein